MRERGEGGRKREMLTCIACSKQANTNNGGSKDAEEEDDERVLGTPRSKQAVKSLTSQVEIQFFFFTRSLSQAVFFLSFFPF